MSTSLACRRWHGRLYVHMLTLHADMYLTCYWIEAIVVDMQTRGLCYLVACLSTSTRRHSRHVAMMLTCMYMWLEAMVDMHTRWLCYLVARTSTALHTCIADMYSQTLQLEHIAWMLTCMYMWIEAIMVDMHTRGLCYLVACTSTAMYTPTLLTRCVRQP